MRVNNPFLLNNLMQKMNKGGEVVDAKTAIKLLHNHKPEVTYNSHAQEDQIINGIYDFQAKKIADLIQHQTEQIERMKCCYNCKHAYMDCDELMCDHINADGDYNFACEDNNHKDWELKEEM